VREDLGAAAQHRYLEPFRGVVPLAVSREVTSELRLRFPLKLELDLGQWPRGWRPGLTRSYE
jgi:hypothetical protein